MVRRNDGRNPGVQANKNAPSTNVEIVLVYCISAASCLVVGARNTVSQQRATNSPLSRDRTRKSHYRYETGYFLLSTCKDTNQNAQTEWLVLLLTIFLRYQKRFFLTPVWFMHENLYCMNFSSAPRSNHFFFFFRFFFHVKLDFDPNHFNEEKNVMLELNFQI